jgi:hypothetical protein
MICKTNQKQVDKAENPSLSGIFPSFFPDSSVLPDWPEEFGSAMNAFSLGSKLHRTASTVHATTPPPDLFLPLPLRQGNP